MHRHTAALALLLLPCLATATTWDEPWQKQVATRADTVGLFEIISTHGPKARVRTIKTLSGEATPAEFDISLDDAMPLTSVSDKGSHEHDTLMLAAGQRAYLWLDHGKAGWTLPTPSAGIDAVQPDGDHVAATYRISFNQALQSAQDYEAVQPCIHRHLHGGQCDTRALAKQLDDPLAQPPAALSEQATASEQALFFRQHVALESAYLLGRDIPLATLEPFLQAGFFHTQISAVRALSASHDPKRNERLLAFIQDKTRLPVAQAMGVVLAGELGDRDLIAKLKAFEKQASQEDAGLPVALMDPRVGTAFPESVRAAIERLR